MAIILDALISIARTAGNDILDVYGTEFSVDTKDDNSPLTLADRRAHRTIAAALADLTPEIPLLSEEGVDDVGEERLSWKRYWLVDPLDGTKEFIKRNGEFTVNIALVEDGAPVVGVVLAPVTGVIYAGDDSGAFVEEADGRRRPIQVSCYESGTLRVVCSRSHRGDKVDRFLERVPSYEVAASGSSLKICLVAEGKADIYPRFGPTSEWDTAAAHAVLNAAGGQLTDLDFQPLRYTKTSLLNPEFLAFGGGTQPWREWLPE